MNKTDKPTLNQNFIIKKQNDNQWFLADCVNGDVYKINFTAYLIITQINSNHSIMEIVDNVLYKYNEVNKEDILSLFEYLYKNNIIHN